MGNFPQRKPRTRSKPNRTKAEDYMADGLPPKRNLSRIRARIKQFKDQDVIAVLAEYIKTSGMEKYVREMDKLEGKDYHLAYGKIAEHFFPKLQKTDNPLAVSEKIHLDFTPALTHCPHCGKPLYEAEDKI